jgi:predicted RNA-binding protein with PIN domain
MEYLLIDGYNVINAWSDLFDLENTSMEECRGKLLHILSNFQGYKKTNIIVVFDAHLQKGSQEKCDTFDYIKVVFTKENETADNYIEKFVYKMGNIHKVCVVTSDYLEQTIIFSLGGIRMSPRELRIEVLETGRFFDEKPLNKGMQKINTVFSNANSKQIDVLEKIRRGK